MEFRVKPLFGENAVNYLLLPYPFYPSDLLLGSTESLTVNKTQTFDDEYSPALFQYNLISQLRTDKDSPPNYKKERGGVTSWGHIVGSHCGVTLWGHMVGSHGGVTLWGCIEGSHCGVTLWGHIVG